MGSSDPQMFIHAGLHKTGTGYLQRHVFPNIQGGTYILGTRRKARDLVDEFSRAEPPILWSQESLSGMRETGDYKESRRRILDFLASTFSGSGLILFLREPSQMIKSFYVQHIHGGGSRQFDDWIRDYDGAFHYDDLLEAVRDQEWGRVLLFDHQQLRDEPEFVISSIERTVGCRFDGWQKSRGTSSNVSAANLGAKTLRGLNKVRVTKYSPRGSRTVTNLMRGVGFTPYYSFQKGSLRWMNKVGRPLFDEETVESLRLSHADSWERAKEKIRENQRGHGLLDRG